MDDPHILAERIVRLNRNFLAGRLGARRRGLLSNVHVFSVAQNASEGGWPTHPDKPAHFMIRLLFAFLSDSLFDNSSSSISWHRYVNLFCHRRRLAKCLKRCMTQCIAIISHSWRSSFLQRQFTLFTNINFWLVFFLQSLAYVIRLVGPHEYEYLKYLALSSSFGRSQSLIDRKVAKGFSGVRSSFDIDGYWQLGKWHGNPLSFQP